ncbi:DUF3270 family protein [Streptococcus plurextorum]|uniref:DUF3270 family protein n=1 Tax=Streptococcus plurextorum TaxID=456876 RepID=UPI0003FF82F8|nr:DUF3270 family protein [Streptococcus plurextorum]
MVTPLRREQETEQLNVNAQPKFQEYQAPVNNKAQLQDVIAIARIVVFAISTVLMCFILLSNNVPSFFAFPLALGLGGVSLITLTFLFELLRR